MNASFPGNLRDEQDAHGQARKLPHAKEARQQVGVRVTQTLGVLESNDDAAAALTSAEPFT